MTYDGERIGRKLAYLLRYGAEKEGLSVGCNGAVPLRQLMRTNLLAGHSEDEVLHEAGQSTSAAGIRRFTVSSDETAISIRANYGRRMERMRCHEGSRVPRLMCLALTKASDSIHCYDLSEFYDDYLLNLIMRDMKRRSLLNGRTLRCLLSPGLSHLDLNGIYLTSKTLAAIRIGCANLKALVLRNCGYIITDHSLSSLLKGLRSLESINLMNCDALTDSAVKALVSHCPSLRHANLTNVPISVEGVVALARSCAHLQELNLFDRSPDVAAAVQSANAGRSLIVRTRQCADLAALDCIWERPNYR